MGKRDGRKRKNLENDETFLTECARSKEVLSRWTGKYRSILIFYKELHRDILRTSSPILFKIYFNDPIVAVEAAKQEVTMGEHIYSVGIGVCG